MTDTVSIEAPNAATSGSAWITLFRAGLFAARTLHVKETAGCLQPQRPVMRFGDAVHLQNRRAAAVAVHDEMAVSPEHHACRARFQP